MSNVALPNINKPRLETRETSSAIKNFLKEEDENKKIVISDKLNALFPEATKIFNKRTSVDDKKKKQLFKI